VNRSVESLVLGPFASIGPLASNFDEGRDVLGAKPKLYYVVRISLVPSPSIPRVSFTTESLD